MGCLTGFSLNYHMTVQSDQLSLGLVFHRPPEEVNVVVLTCQSGTFVDQPQ